VNDTVYVILLLGKIEHVLQKYHFAINKNKTLLK